jgi:murein DD-endopeptidase MepM/ murein hydrolase activator NlpD
LILRRLLITMLALTVSLSSLPLFAQSTYAQKQPSYANGDASRIAEIVKSVNFRKGPSQSSERIRYLRVGEKVEIIDQVNAYWYKVKDSKDRIGYVTVLKKYIRVLSPKHNSSSEAKVVRGVSLRSGPSTENRRIRYLQREEKVTILEQTNKYWYKVKDSNGTSGYVSSNERFIDMSYPAKYNSDSDRSGYPSASARKSSIKDGIFPIKKGTYKPFKDNFGVLRTWSPEGRTKRSHEGIDISAPKGTPLYSATDGKIVRYGWNQYGGWRMTIKAHDKYLYYAHMDKYAPGWYKGATVKKGQLIGYVGKTGYGPPGTEGVKSHLHFAIFEYGSAINPYPYLKIWEQNK